MTSPAGPGGAGPGRRPWEDAGSLAPLYDAVDWAAGPLGPPEDWDGTLRGALALALTTRFPVTLLWGPEHVLVYNAAYAEIIEDKHPDALGRRCADVFPEAWPVIGPMLADVMAGGGPTWTEDVRMPLVRRGGRSEECYFTFSYSPVATPDGRVAGVLDITAETTRQVVDRRRLALLAQLTDRLSDLEDAEGLPAAALPVLRSARHDLVDPALLGPDDGLAPLDRDLVVEEVAEEEVEAGATRRHRVLVRLPGVLPRAQRPVLVTGVDPEVPVDRVLLEFLVLVAGVLGTALERARAHAVERASGQLARSMSEALQRDLLTPLPQPDHVQLAARYQPAASELAVGGDWYDAFTTADGGTSLVVGDVSGHDAGAAVAMAQVRNVLRGVGHALGEPPAAVLDALDRAMRDLAVGALATAVLARLEDDEHADEGRGGHRVRWANAGHVPPVLVHPDGRVELLQRRSDLLLGLSTGAARRDHDVALPPGATFLLVTDGLVERRGAHLSEGLAWLRGTVERLARAGATVEELLDGLLAEVGPDVEDDVALLAVRAHPRDRPRPPEAGPEVGPDELLRGEVGRP
ncbi:SpoIIE family protein phosphatase [uncultured Pseudokineococcus sp.]|uniref:SpoIIE family protein phosphatase n=1 Tax=uncultured Pseudokineococcus sp. TaxID=1642928 RepID=UPI0026365DD3|nr:SpoIIE family protein phosphatase [uncultured Pseudokineococcus sp.]